MSRVLLLGESWFTYSVHQKGFDAFYTSEYVEGGAEFVAALEKAGHSVTRIPSHELPTRLPTSGQQLLEMADVIVVSDVGANSFLITPDTFNRSIPGVDLTAALRDFTHAGGGLLMVGGYMSFSGVDGKARWARSALADALPVVMLDRDDRVELPAGANPSRVGDHPLLEELEMSWPAVLGYNEVQAKPHASVLAEVNGDPLLVLGTYGEGRAAAYSSDLAPHWAPPSFVAWRGYDALFAKIVRWLAGEGE